MIMSSLADLKNVNSKCQTKIRELNVCKAELGKLSSLVEEKLDQIQAGKQSKDDLEKDLKKARSDIDSFVSSLGKL